MIYIATTDEIPLSATSNWLEKTINKCQIAFLMNSLNRETQGEQQVENYIGAMTEADN